MTCWRAANGICSKRLVPYLPELVRVLEPHGELSLEPQTKERLLALSAATADRLLQAERKLSKPHGLGTTKPETLLKSAIPIRTFAEWDEARPGFTEIDLVVHCGTTTRGEYLHSLTMTDIAAGWTECVALRNRGQQSVCQALVLARARLPFPLRGIDAVKASLRQQYASLNPVALLRQMQRLQGVLWKLAVAEPPAQDRVQPASS